MQRPSDSIPLQGGLNLVTPAVRMTPGHAIAAVNYEPVERGYHRQDGIERFDGRPKPSEASYSVLNFDAGTATIAEGATVTGQTSSATGVALIAMVVSTGTFGGGDAAGYLVLTNVSGTFQDNENLRVGGVTKCVANGTATDRGATTDADDTTWIRDAIETARAAIGTVTGSGRSRGGFVYNGSCYTFRDNAGGTACVLYKQSTAGWVAQSLGSYLKYDAGTVEFTEGQTLTGGTSAATATIRRVANRTGTWSGSATGLLILTGITGTFQNNETITDGGGGSATADGVVTANALPPGGRYECFVHNFFGASNLKRVYGVNGVGPAFEWDGTYFVPLFTGMTTDTPDHIWEHKMHILLSFPGGSVQNSGTGDPYAWSPVTGAAEMGIGDDVTGFADETTGTVAIFARNKIRRLLGSDATEFVLDPVTREGGAIEWTIQKLGNVIFHDDLGLRDMRTAQFFTDTKFGTLTNLVEPLLKAKKKRGVTPTASLACKSKGQYRLFWSDGTGITMFLGRKQPEILPFDLEMTVYATWTGEASDGSELMFMGSDDGYVYQVDAGTSFDGDAVTAYIRLAFYDEGSPTQNKRYHKATVQMDGPADMTLGLVAEFDFANSDQPLAVEQSFNVQGGGGFWDDSDWNDFVWSAAVEGVAEAGIDGFGANVSVAMISAATYEEPHTLHGLVIHSSPRGLKR